MNCFLLKCRKLRREDQETSDWIVSRILLLRTQAVGVVIEISILSNFTWYLIGIFGRGTFEGGDNFKQCMQLREALVLLPNFLWF